LRVSHLGEADGEDGVTATTLVMHVSHRGGSEEPRLNKVK